MIPRYSLPEISDIWTDKGKYDLWQEIEILYCEGLAEYGHIPKKAARDIRKNADYNVRRVLAIEKRTRHDVIAFLTNMSEYIGPSGRYLHMGMTSSDLLDTTLACQMREAGKVILGKMRKLRTVLRRRAVQYKHVPMVGRSHGIHAEPITMGLKILVWYSETERNIERLERAIEEISVGQITGTVGTMSHVDPRVERYVMKRLGLRPSPVTTQVIQRDRHAYYMSTLAVIGASLESVATEIRALQRTDIGEAEEPFTKGQKGSSAMPHKRNPILTERVAGMARLLRGNAQAALENVTLWHERDISHSSVERIIIPDSTMVLGYMLEKLTWVIAGMKINKKRMRENLDRTGGLIFSHPLLLLLVGKGMAREKAYRIIQESAMRSMEGSKSFREYLSEDKRFTEVVSKEELEEAFDVKSHLKKIDFIFKRALRK